MPPFPYSASRSILSGHTIPYQAIYSHPSPSSTFQCSQVSYIAPCAYIHYLGCRLDDNLPSILILKDVDQCINHGKQEYFKKLDRSGYRSSMEHCGMPWNNIEHPGSLWNMVEHHGTQWKLVRILWKVFGQNWNLAGITLFSI